MTAKLLLKPTSALKKFVTELPDDWSLKTASTKNEMLKKVKQEELDYSGVGARIDAHINEKITKQDLVDWEVNREDIWRDKQLKASRNETSYDSITLTDSSDPSYTEDLRRYHTASEVKKVRGAEGRDIRTVSPHFGSEVSDYFSHSRYTVEPIGDVENTRLVQEIQSDLHQQGRQQGYQGDTWYEVVDDTGYVLDEFNNRQQAEKSQILLTENGMAIPTIRETTKHERGVPDAPLKKNWARKEIERQILAAVDEGQGSIAIPLEGARRELARAEGVQKWYETAVRSTLKKITKQIPGAEYKEIGQGIKPRSYTLPEDDGTRILTYMEFLTEDEFFADDLGPMLYNRGLIPDPNNTSDYTAEELARIIIRLPDAEQAGIIEQYNRLPRNINKGITYGQIVLPLTEKIAKELPFPPKTFAEFDKYLRNAFSGDLAKSADYMAELRHEIVAEQGDDLATLSDQDIVDYISKNWDNILQSTGSTETSVKYKYDSKDFNNELYDYILDNQEEIYPKLTEKFGPSNVDWSANEAASAISELPESQARNLVPEFFKSIEETVPIQSDKLVWPELTPEVHEVFKRWETPPKDLKGLNKLQKELPEQYSNNLQNAAVTKALHDQIPNVEDLRLAINSSTDIYHSVFGEGNLLATIDDLHPNDIAKLPVEIRSIVEKAKKTLDDPKVVVDFVHEYWPQISKEQKYPLKETKITPATYKYPEWTKKFELYTVGALGVASTMTPEQAQANNDPVGQALSKNASLGAIREHLMNNEGLSEEEANWAIDASIQQKIDSALEKGASSESVQKHVEDLYPSVKAEFNYGIDKREADKVYTFPEEELAGWQEPEYVPVSDVTQYDDKSNEELIAAKENLILSYQFMMEDLGTTIGGSEEAKIRFNKMNKTNKYAVANTLRSMGRNVEVNAEMEFVEIQPDGIQVEITPDWYGNALWDMAKAEKEIGMAVGGAIVGERIAAGLGAPGKLLGFLTRFTGGIAGGSTGAAAGRGLDLAYNAQTLGEELEAEYYKKMMMDTGYWDAAMGATISLGGAAVIKSTIGLGKAAKMIMDGNRNGAYKFLKDFMHLNNAQIDQIIKEWETVTGGKAPGMTRATKAMHVIPQTQPGGEAIVSSAAGMNPKMSADLSRQISTRAKDLNEVSQNLTTGNVASVLYDDLGKYELKVKEFYGGIKQLGIAPFKKSGYRFNFEKLGINKVIESTNKTITNKAIRKRFKLYVDTIENLSTKRSFKNLLELRSTLNEFKYNTRLRKHIDWKMINSSIHKVDKEISKAAHEYMPAGDVWLKDWAKANTEYSKMLKLRKNVLYRALTRKGVDHKRVVNAAARHITSIDGTFMEVVSKLPDSTKKKVEGLVFDTLVKKHTIGFESGLQATHFTNLQEELSHIPFSSLETRRVKRAVNGLAKVFKNDVNLSQGTGQIARPKFQSYLTTDPVVRAKYEIASNVFNYIKRLSPTESGKYVALVTKTAKILENPRDSKTVEELIKLLPKDSEITSGLHQLALVSAKFGKKDKLPYVTTYKAGRKGQAHKVIDGKLGRGIYWSTDKHGITASARATERKVFTEDLLPTRIATETDVKNILGIDEVTAKIVKEHPELQDKLKERLYDGLAIDHDVIIFE